MTRVLGRARVEDSPIQSTSTLLISLLPSADQQTCCYCVYGSCTSSSSRPHCFLQSESLRHPFLLECSLSFPSLPLGPSTLFCCHFMCVRAPCPLWLQCPTPPTAEPELSSAKGLGPTLAQRCASLCLGPPLPFWSPQITPSSVSGQIGLSSPQPGFHYLAEMKRYLLAEASRPCRRWHNK